MSWQLQPVNDASSPQPGGNSVDDFIRQNVVMAKLEDMVAWGRKNSVWPFNLVSHAAMWRWPQLLRRDMT